MLARAQPYAGLECLKRSEAARNETPVTKPASTGLIGRDVRKIAEGLDMLLRTS
jgi:hypothetical protein